MQVRQLNNLERSSLPTPIEYNLNKIPQFNIHHKSKNKTIIESDNSQTEMTNRSLRKKSTAKNRGFSSNGKIGSIPASDFCYLRPSGGFRGPEVPANWRR